MRDLAFVAAGFAAGLLVGWWFYRAEPALRGEGVPGSRDGGDA